MQNGHTFDPLTARRSHLLDVVANAITLRTDLMRRLGDPRRDVEAECGHHSLSQYISAEEYQQYYDRDPIAARVVEVLARESWQVQPLVYEEESSEKATALEEAWDALSQGLRGEQSWYADEAGSPIWDYLQRLDELSGIGQYGAMLLGLDDGLPLNQPVRGFAESGSAAAGKVKTADGFVWSAPSTNDAIVPYRMTVNAEATSGRKLRYLRVFPETLAEITRFESNPTSPRHGQPIEYLLTFNDPRSGWAASGFGMGASTQTVHWTRVIHVADNLSSSEVFGRPRMAAVIDRLKDLRKVYGSDAEAWWKNCIMRIFFITHPELGADVEVDNAGIKDAMENMENGLQRWMSLNGMSPSTVAPSIADPTDHINVQIEAICIRLGIPKRVFMGSERGELASSQDDAAWNDRLKFRQQNHITPRIIIPFVDRLIACGVLPKPGGSKVEKTNGKAGKAPPAAKAGYHIEWPDLTSETTMEKADVAVKKTSAMAQYVSGGVEALMEPLDYLTRVLGMEDAEAEAVIEAAETAQEEKMAEREEEADALGMEKEAPPGFVKPEPEAPSPPVKVKPGEKLVRPENVK